MRGAGPGEFHRHRPTRSAGPQHDNALALDFRDLPDGFHHPLAVIVMTDQTTFPDRHVVGGANGFHVRVHLVQERDRCDLPRHGDTGAGKAQGAYAADGRAHLSLRGHIAFPELPMQAIVGKNRIEHLVDRILGDRVADHGG